MAQAKGLGRGLSALLGEQAVPSIVQQDNAPGKQLEIPVSSISSWSKQPRQFFDETELSELAESIRINGVVQPIVVRKSGTNKYEIIAGERRWRASQLAGLEKIPAVVMDVNDNKALEIALIENIQRKDLRPLEMAESYQRLIDEHKYTQEQLGEVLGKSRPQIANTLRLLTLPENIKSMLNDEKLTAGHARTLVGSKHADVAAERIIKLGLNVRQAEALIKKLEEEGAEPRTKAPARKTKPEEIKEIEKQISDALGFPSRIEEEKGKGKLVIVYDQPENLNEILSRLKAT